MDAKSKETNAEIPPLPQPPKVQLQSTKFTALGRKVIEILVGAVVGAMVGIALERWIEISRFAISLRNQIQGKNLADPNIFKEKLTPAEYDGLVLNFERKGIRVDALQKVKDISTFFFEPDETTVQDIYVKVQIIRFIPDDDGRATLHAVSMPSKMVNSISRSIQPDKLDSFNVISEICRLPDKARLSKDPPPLTVMLTNNNNVIAIVAAYRGNMSVPRSTSKQQSRNWWAVEIDDYTAGGEHPITHLFYLRSMRRDYQLNIEGKYQFGVIVNDTGRATFQTKVEDLNSTEGRPYPSGSRNEVGEYDVTQHVQSAIDFGIEHLGSSSPRAKAAFQQFKDNLVFADPSWLIDVRHKQKYDLLYISDQK